MMPLTPKQKRAVAAIRAFMAANNGEPPTGVKLAELLKTTTNSAYCIRDALVRRGHATKVKDVPYSFQLIEERERA